MNKFLSLLATICLFAAPAFAQFNGGGSGGSITLNTTCPTSTVSGSSITLTGGLPPVARSSNTGFSGSTDTILTGDCGGSIEYTNTTSTAVTLPTPTGGSAGTGNFPKGFIVQIFAAYNAGTVTITTSSAVFNSSNATTLTVAAGKSVALQSDGTNWNVGTQSSGGGSGTLTSVTCAVAGNFTISGTCAVSDTTYAGPQTNLVITIPSGVTEVMFMGCGPGGGGGGGNTTAGAGTGSAGGASGGGGDCHTDLYKVADVTNTLAQTTFYLNGGGGGSGGAATIQGSQGTAFTVSHNSSGCTAFSTFTGTSSSSDTTNCLDTWGAGGGGGAGTTTATASQGGAGGSRWANGGNATATAATGCGGTSLSNGGATGVAINAIMCGAGGSGSSTVGVAGNGAYGDVNGGPGGESGGGVSVANAGVSANPSKGGGSPGCITPPAGGVVSANGGSTVTPSLPYQVGCGGASGGGATSGTAGNGSNGSQGGGGGGGGTAYTGGTGGSGGNGGAGFIRVVYW